MCLSVALLKYLVELKNHGHITVSPGFESSVRVKLQALVYDILSSSTAVFSYAIGSRKLSANEQFFVGAPTVVRLLQTTQIISAVCLINMLLKLAEKIHRTKIV